MGIHVFMSLSAHLLGWAGRCGWWEVCSGTDGSEARDAMRGPGARTRPGTWFQVEQGRSLHVGSFSTPDATAHTS